MLYCIEELRITAWHIIERWICCINNYQVLHEEQEEHDFYTKMSN